MLIRSARLEDIEVILTIDHSYTTDWAWQMRVGSDSTAPHVHFQLVRLPRQLHVSCPHSALSLRRVLHRCDYVWVAQDEESGHIQGYLGMALLPWQNTAWVPLIAVPPHIRRQGIATSLVQRAITQARQEKLHSVTLEVSSKNYPATRLAQALGMRFSGYADNYYGGSEIALFFAYRISAR